MFSFIIKRALEAIPVLLIIITATFFMIRLAPGGPFDAERALSQEAMERLNAYYGLDKPLFQQYTQYLKNLLHGDLGPSLKYPGFRVSEIIFEKIPISMELGLYAFCLAMLVGITAGVCASLKPNTWLDYSTMSFAMIGICLPSFVLGPLLLLVFALHLEWLNASGWAIPADKILPTITLAVYFSATLARITRGSMLEIQNQDYMRTAKAKGLPPWRIHFVHGLRNALLPVASITGPALAGLISGSFVVETVYHIPGLGRFFVQAAFNRDYSMILGTVLFFAVLIVFFNLLVDILMAWLNPRIKITQGT